MTREIPSRREKRAERTIQTLDSFGYHPDLIVMDVDGAELDVIKGGLQTFSQCPISIIECEDAESRPQIERIMNKRSRHLAWDDYMFFQ